MLILLLEKYNYLSHLKIRPSYYILNGFKYFNHLSLKINNILVLPRIFFKFIIIILKMFLINVIKSLTNDSSISNAIKNFLFKTLLASLKISL